MKSAGGRHECRCNLGPRGRYDASGVAAPERAALSHPSCLGRVLPRLGRAALSRDHPAALPHMQQGATWERPVTVNGHGASLTTTCCSGRRHLRVPPAGQRRTDGYDGGGSAGRRADRRTVSWRSHDDPRRGAAGTAWRSFVPPPGWE